MGFLVCKSRHSYKPSFESSFLDHFFPEIFSGIEDYWSPKSFSKEDEGNIYLSFEVPGFDNSDLSVTFKDQVLGVKGELKDPERKFERSLKITHKIQEEGVVAVLKNGILLVTLPKDTTKAESKKIPIEVKG